MSAKREAIRGAFWWGSLSRNFDNVDREFIKRALAAEQAETGHECGHRFEISVRSAGHYGIAGEGSESHSDAPYFESDVPMVVEVRAHNLRDALLVAATLPLNDWMPDEDADS
jgi:hypothetical protein